MTVAAFHDLGISPHWIAKLKMWVSGVARTLKPTLSMCEGMSLRPEDLLTHSDDNSLRTKLTGMSLNTKSGVSHGVKIR